MSSEADKLHIYFDFLDIRLIRTPVIEILRGTRREIELRSMGADLRIESSDATNKDDVLRLVQHLRSSLPPIAGVVNGAMVMHDQPFGDMHAETLRKVLGPKVEGSRVLDEVFWDTPLDFFIMTSSTAAVIG